MISNDREYRLALQQVARDEEFAAAQRKTLEQLGLAPDEVKRGLEPTISFHAQLREEMPGTSASVEVTSRSSRTSLGLAAYSSPFALRAG